MGMVVIQPYILMSKLNNPNKVHTLSGYLNSIRNHIKQDLLLILVLIGQ